MAILTGEYECTIDVKGRLALPSGLLKQLPENSRQRFMINRSIFEKCLVLYPIDAWEKVMADVNELNRFSRKTDLFVRQYSNGASVVEVDTSNRILFPKRLAAYAGITKSVVLAAHIDNKVEIWDEKSYNDLMSSFNPDVFGDLAEEVLGKGKSKSGDNVS